MLPAAIILASINITPEQWLMYTASDKERLINTWFQQQNMASTGQQRVAMVVAIDDYVRCATNATRPAGVVDANGNTTGSSSRGSLSDFFDGTTGVDSTGSGSSGTNSQNGLDPTTARGSQFWQAVATGAFGLANNILNTATAGDRQRIQNEAAANLARTQLQYDSARNAQERLFYGQQLDFMRQIANRGSATAGWIALGVAGMVVLGGVLYATSRSKKSNPTHRRAYRPYTR